jgi:hypothetical protein
MEDVLAAFAWSEINSALERKARPVIRDEEVGLIVSRRLMGSDALTAAVRDAYEQSETCDPEQLWRCVLNRVPDEERALLAASMADDIAVLLHRVFSRAAFRGLV